MPKSETRRGRVIEQGRISPTLDTGCQIGVVEEMTKCINSKVNGKQPPIQNRIYDAEGNSPALDTWQQGHKIIEGVRIRKLTPRECFRLQGFPDDYYERAAAVNSDSQLYKQAGNSVTVNVIYEIAKRLKEIEGVDK